MGQLPFSKSSLSSLSTAFGTRRSQRHSGPDFLRHCSLSAQLLPMAMGMLDMSPPNSSLNRIRDMVQMRQEVPGQTRSSNQ